MNADAIPFLVVIDGRRSAMPWGKYSTWDAAEEDARKLRALGMSARVVAPLTAIVLRPA